MAEMGARGREFARESLLLTRQLREYLTLFLAIRHGGTGRYVPV
jgi:trehalose synthase